MVAEVEGETMVDWWIEVNGVVVVVDDEVDVGDVDGMSVVGEGFPSK